MNGGDSSIHARPCSKKRLSNEVQNRILVLFSFLASLPFSLDHTFPHLPSFIIFLLKAMHTKLPFLTTRTIAVVTFLLSFFLCPVLDASSVIALEPPASISQPQPQHYSSVAGTGADRKMRKRYVPLGGGVGSFMQRTPPRVGDSTLAGLVFISQQVWSHHIQSLQSTSCNPAPSATAVNESYSRAERNKGCNSSTNGSLSASITGTLGTFNDATPSNQSSPSPSPPKLA